MARRALPFRAQLRTVSALGLLGAIACGGPQPDAPPRHVLLISIDTLRPDHLSLYGYERETSPRIDAFFGEAELFERAYSAEASTAPSVASLLTGLHPQNHGIRLFYQRLDAGIPTIADQLRRAGFQTPAVVSNVVLTAEAMGVDTRFDHYDDYVDEREGMRPVWERRASRTTDAAIEWLERHRDPESRSFLWVHYIDPHTPYDPPADRPVDYTHEGRHPIDIRRVPPSAVLRENREDGLEYIDRYDEEIAYTDREVGRLLDAWHEKGLTEDSIVVFTADHGEAMIEGERYFAHGYDVSEPVNRVPLVVRRPGLEAVRHQTPVSTVDILPSILAWTGVEPVPRVDGKVLGTRGARDAVSLESTTRNRQLRAAVAGDRKWIVTRDVTGEVTERSSARLPETGAAVSEESLEKSWPEGAGREALERWLAEDAFPKSLGITRNAGRRLAGPKVAPGRTDEHIEALRALGYVE